MCNTVQAFCQAGNSGKLSNCFLDKYLACGRLYTSAFTSKHQTSKHGHAWLNLASIPYKRKTKTIILTQLLPLPFKTAPSEKFYKSPEHCSELTREKVTGSILDAMVAFRWKRNARGPRSLRCRRMLINTLWSLHYSTYHNRIAVLG